jgi:hypothetical protein
VDAHSVHILLRGSEGYVRFRSKRVAATFGLLEVNAAGKIEIERTSLI